MTLLSNALAKLTGSSGNVRRLPQTQTAGSGIIAVAPGLPANFGAGMNAQMLAYGQSGWLFSVLDRVGTAVATPDWKLYRKAGSASKRQEVERHPALDLLARPNPFVDRREFLIAGQQHMDLVGETWWHIVFERRTRQPAELWVLRPDRMRPVPHPTEFVAGYEYRVGGRWEPLDREEIVFARDPNPFDPYRGLGRVQSFLVDIGSERLAAEWTRSFFHNNAEPGGVIEFPEMLSDPEYEKFVTRWRQQHQGVQNARRVAVLEGAKWVDIKYSQRDMQFNDLRKLHRDIILGAFGISAAMLGITESVNRANAEAGEVMFARWLVVPRLRRIRGMLNARIAPLFGDDLEFDYIDPTPENQELDLDTADRGFKAGFLTRNEARLLVNQDEVPDGDQYVWDLQPAPPAPTASPAPQPDEKRRRERIVLTRSAGAEEDPLLTTAEERAEAAMRRAWARRLAAEADGLAGMLESKAVIMTMTMKDVVEQAELDAWDWDWYAKYADDVIEEIVRALEIGGLAAEPNVSVPLLQREAVDWARQRASALLLPDGVVSLLKFTKRRLAELVAQTLESGESLQTLAKRLHQDYAFSAERAETIARTETATALGQGAKRAALMQGRNEKRWTTQADPAVEDLCRRNTAQGWIKMGEPFATGHDTIPAHDRCRCVVRYRTAPQVSDVDPGEGLAEDVAAAREGSRSASVGVGMLASAPTLAEIRCPQCNKLLAKDAPPGTYWCRRCKAERAVSAGAGDMAQVAHRERVQIERDADGNMVAFVREVY